MRSRGVLGAVALAAIVIAAISFAVVDVSTSAASGCLDAGAPCTDRTVPPIAVVFALIGAAALLASVVPAIAWIVRVVSHQSAKHTEVDYTRLPSARVADDDAIDAPVTPPPAE